MLKRYIFVQSDKNNVNNYEKHTGKFTSAGPGKGKTADDSGRMLSLNTALKVEMDMKFNKMLAFSVEIVYCIMHKGVFKRFRYFSNLKGVQL